MTDANNLPGLDALTPTLCQLLHIQPPALCNAAPLENVIAAAQEILEGQPLERVLIFAPDALGRYFIDRHAGYFEQSRNLARCEALVRAPFPPKTPVCFASMFTGTTPERHGITAPIRPTLKCDTFFDALLRAGKRVAMVAVYGSSCDLIFRDRPIPMTYYAERYDMEVAAQTGTLLIKDGADVIVAYQQEYDDLLHKTAPESPEALTAAARHARTYNEFAGAAAGDWRRFHHAIVFAPDHGCHFDPEIGRGTHGEDRPEDREVLHFYRFVKGAR